MPTPRKLAPLNPFVLLAVVAEYLVTTIHHIYGGIVLGTPERLYMAFAFTVVLGVTIALYRWAGEDRAGRAALAAILALFWVGLLGGFEGGYNHVHASLRFFRGDPMPGYPAEIFFQATGVLTFVTAVATAAALLRLTRRPGAGGGRIPAGTLIAPFELEAIDGARVRSPSPSPLTHLQFRRFAGCPVCDMHLRSFAKRISEIEQAGVREVVFFHSTAEALRPHAKDLPFATIADPDKRRYRQFGVEAGLEALLDPRAWRPIVTSISEGLARIREAGGDAPRVDTEGGRLGLPADFLIDSSGRVVASHYGEHVYDQWSVDDVLTLARQVGQAARTANDGPDPRPATPERGLAERA